MSITTETIPLIEPDASAVGHADRVIAGLGLPVDGIAVDDPATGEVIGHIADIDVEGALLAVETADAAGEDWARTTPRH